jgi:hypothetical protein
VSSSDLLALMNEDLTEMRIHYEHIPVHRRVRMTDNYSRTLIKVIVSDKNVCHVAVGDSYNRLALAHNEIYTVVMIALMSRIVHRHDATLALVFLRANSEMAGAPRLWR